MSAVVHSRSGRSSALSYPPANTLIVPGAFAGGYDANGNLTSRVVDGAGQLLTYDAENRLTGISGGATASFVYDGDGARVKGTVGGVTTAYIGDWFEWSGSTSTMKRYYYAGGTRVAMREGATLYYLLSDHLGSTSLTTDSLGNRISELRYKAWGEIRYTYGTTPTKRHYTGQYHEQQAGGIEGLYFYGARWLDVALGRFLSADSFIPDLLNPLDYDRYSYARSNPIKYVDSTGHFPDLLLDLAFIVYDVIQIQQEGWTLVNTAALCADVAAALIPIGTGGGPAVRAAMAGSDVVLSYARAAEQVPDVIRAGQAAEKLFQFADSSSGSTDTSSTQGHHPWPQYLLGPEKQELYNLDSKLHSEYHSQLDKYLSRRFGTEYYVKLLDTQERINQLLEGLMEFNKYFDKTYKTHTYEALEDVLRNGGYLPKP